MYEYLDEKTISISRLDKIDKEDDTYRIVLLVEDKRRSIPGTFAGMTTDSPHVVGTSRVVGRHDDVAVKW